MEAMKVRASIIGLSATIQVSQTFRNTLSEALEVTYIFPLPPRAAVSAFTLEVEGRKVEGIIKERGQARRDYDQAIRTGHRAAITEEDRSGVFTMRAGNIMPGETAIVHLTLDGPLAIEDGDPCFRFPLVVAPRYMPGSALEGASVGDGTAVDTDAVPDASRISPPVLLKGCKSPVRLTLEVDIDSGELPLSDLRSSLHSIITEQRGGRTCIRLQPGERLDRDFILRFGLGAEEVGTQLAICPDKEKREDGNDGTIALTLVPPKSSIPSRPRDVIFVLDRSGSMGGWKMVAARRAVGRMLDTLGDSDRYNVYAFDNRIETPTNAEGLKLLEATNRNRYRTLEWLSSVDAEGGTEMLEPISKAFGELAGGYQERDRMMVLITDGQVGNEDQILRSVKDEMRNVRVFTIGIDRAVNEGFLRRLAVMGGGSCALVESEDRLDDVMDHIHRRIATPVVTELVLKGEGIEIDASTIVPKRLPDLFEGCPTVVRARYKGAPSGSLRLSGSDSIGMPYSQQVEVRPSNENSVHTIWARGRVRDLEDRYAIGDGDLGTLEKQILGISLGFRVLSRFTSFVAVDKQVVNPGGEGSSIVQPVESPEGWASGGEALLQESAKFSISSAFGGGGASPPAPGNAPAPASMPMRALSMAAPPQDIDFESAPESLEELDEREEDCDDLEAGELADMSISGYAPEPMESLQSSAAPPQQSMAKAKRRQRSSTGAIAASKPMKRGRGLFRKHEAPSEKAASAEPVDTLSAYQQRLRELMQRASSAGDSRAQLRVLLQGLTLMLDDLKSVHAPATFVAPLTKVAAALRALWGTSQVSEALAEQVRGLEALCNAQGPGTEPEPTPKRRGFWK
jgi:Ca-activated chloride channel family protein